MLPPASGPMRTYLLADHRHNGIAELIHTSGRVDPGCQRSGHIAAHRLAVRPGQPLYRAQRFLAQLQPENLPDLIHTTSRNVMAISLRPLAGRWQ